MKIRERNISLTSYHEHVEIKLFPLKKKKTTNCFWVGLLFMHFWDFYLMVGMINPWKTLLVMIITVPTSDNVHLVHLLQIQQKTNPN